jgi:uncharacterized protein
MKPISLLLASIIFAVPVAAIAASFDCSKAKSKTEILICSDADVSSLDESLGIAYKSAYSRVENKIGLRQSQREWLASYSFTSCTNITCLKKQISERIEILNEVSAEGEATSGWTGNFVRYWNGKVDRNAASISIIGLRTKGLHISGKALWYGPNARSGQVNDGVMEGYTSSLTQDGVAIFDFDDCTAQLQLRGDVLEVNNEHGCGGLNVTFNGQYRRK